MFHTRFVNNECPNRGSVCQSLVSSNDTIVRHILNQRPDRVPFRDVQNELLNLQETQLFPKHAPRHENIPEIKHGDAIEETFSNKCNVQTITNTPEAYSDEQTVEPTNEHQDVTLKSFVCLEGEVVVEDEPAMSDESILIRCLAMENNQSTETDLNETNQVDCTNDNQTNEEHVDHPYSHVCRSDYTDSSYMSNRRKEASGCELWSVTFKPHVCLDGEVQTLDQSSIITDESILVNDPALGSHLPSLGTKTHISEEYTETLSVNYQPMDHSYSDLKAHVVSSEESTADAMFHPCPSTDQYITTQCEKNAANHSDDELSDLSERPHEPSSRQGEITLKSFSCLGVEIEIADLSKMSEMSFCMVNPAKEQGQHCLNDISHNDGQSIAVLTPGSKHVDHFYCHITDDNLLMEKSSHEIEVCTKSPMFPESLTEKSENADGHITLPYGNITDKVSGPFMCLEMEASKNVTSHHLSALSHYEKKMQSSDVVKSLSDDEYKLPNDENFIIAEKFVEEHLDHHLEADFSHAEETSGISSPRDAVSKIADSESNNVNDNALCLKEEGILSEIEFMRLCDQTGDTISVSQDHTSPIPLTGPCTPKMSAVSRTVSHDYMLSRLWPELPESPLPPPQFNSTTLANTFSFTPITAKPPQEIDLEANMASRDIQKILNDPPVLSNGPLQEQLRQMAELLMLASGKVVAPTAAPVNHCNASVGTSPVQMRSVSVWGTPVQQMERSMNTSEVVEIVKDVPVSDASTRTDSLLWKNLEHLSRSELEQRLTSTLIMVEVLSQQLTSARSYNPSKDTSPSDLRDKLIQTDHTELKQNGMYKDLYVTAQERIQSLEHDQETLQSLFNRIQEMRVEMCSVKSSTEDSIFTIKQIGDMVNVDQETLSKQVHQMKSMYRRYRETLQKMDQKMNDMRQKMEKALQEKEAAFSVTQQLRDYHASQVAELEKSVGSHQELMSALTLAYPSLLRKAQELIQKTNPVLYQLHQRTVTAMQQSKQHLAMRDRAVEERDLLDNELEQMRSSLQDASEQISDLSMQQTIMTSEMSVLREQLNQAEEERSELQRTNTELSATVTSTLASYAFLEKTLASETSKMQQAVHDSHQATEKVYSLEVELETSWKQIQDYEAVLSQRESLIQELHTEAEIHHRQLNQLAQLQTELSSAKEMTEFLQAENELAREQMEESERLLRCHLQGLRERNLECEDLRLALGQLRLEKDSIQEELESTRDKARQLLLEQGEKMAQASKDVLLLYHRVCSLTTILKEYLSNKESESSDKILQSHRHPSSSFVDSIMVAMMKTDESETQPPVLSEKQEEQQDGIGGEVSAFTRIPPNAHKEDKDERRSCVLELLSDLDETISNLHMTIDQLKAQKDTEQQTLQQTICGLQEALQEASQRHTLEISELRLNVVKLQTRMEKDASALVQKTQELRREVADLRRLEQQAQVEAQVLREELKRSGFRSAASTTALDDRIKLLREVEKLKANLMETEENRAKVLERAKRHQRVHAMNQTKLERELHLLDDMIETVRRTLSSIPDPVKSCPELQKLIEFLG
ncbi:Sperm-associated antigen 5 [Triplophysa tibetana]|uniref:Sperm-associated antigen 5 n=1 Tax=Triplophysa tibetana TaxID=1572043 RepID=A0A5A9PMQ4_9TELE|nr:Sperm-associated antigen 5 [Triplophysa tibetana]